MPEQRRVGGRYLLVRELATGGMGTVWLARDETLRRDVAVKILHLQPGITDTAREQAVGRAMREARIAARLHHPNAVQVYDVVDDHTGPCLVMQYVPSRSLAAVVAEDGPLAPHVAARVGTQVAAALAAAHRVGIVHRDVKPGNVLIAEDGTAKITDFGVSHAFDDVTVTSTGMLTGTPAFLSPEAARGEDATAASDVFSLGSTLYFAVEGRAPFGDDGNPMAVLHRVASARPPQAQRAGTLAPMLQQMMAPAPADRPAMVAIAARLPELHPLTTDGAAPQDAATRQLRPLPAVPSAVAPAPTPPPAARMDPVPLVGPEGDFPGRDDRPEHRRTWLPITAAVVVVAVGVVLAVVLLRNASSGDSSADGPVSTPAPAGTTPRPSSTTPTPMPTPTPTPTPTTSPASTSPSGTPSSSATTGAGTTTTPPTSAQLRDAVVSYFRLIPGDLDAGWARLTSSFQQGRAGGRASYDDYWRSVRRVDVENPQGDAPRTVRARLVYHYANGRVVRQTTTFRLVRDGGVLKIDGQA